MVAPCTSAFAFTHRKGYDTSEIYNLRGHHTFRECRSDRSDRIPDAIDIVSPGTSLAISALARLAIFLITIQITSSCTPTTILDSEEDHFPLSSNLEAFVDGISSSLVVTSDSWVRAFDLGNSSVSCVPPTAEMDVS